MTNEEKAIEINGKLKFNAAYQYKTVVDVLVEMAHWKDELFAKERERLEKQKSDWSEEDEKFFKTALWHISHSISNSKSTDIHCDTTDWLKSLKERYIWKPTDEQLQALEWSLGDYWNVVFEERHDTLTSLYNDLKKLKGE